MTVIEGRLHPVTPLRRSWAALAALTTLGYQTGGSLFTENPGAKNDINLDISDIPTEMAAAATVVIIVTVVTCFTAAWRASYYRLEDDVLEYRFGLVFKTRRRFELHHVQTASIQRPLLGRLIGVCTLRVDLAGPTMTLSYLTLTQAEALKAAILHEDTDAAPLYRVRTRDLALSLLLDVRESGGALLALAVALAPYVWTGHLLALSTLIALAPKAWRMTAGAFFSHHGFTVTRAAEGGYRIDSGLVNRSQYTYGRDRIASVQMYQPVLWRRLDWVRVHVAVAGLNSQGTLLPVAPRHVAEKMIAHLLTPDAVTLLDTHVPVPERARRRTVFHRAYGYILGDRYFVTWEGLFLRNIVTLAPLARIQEVSVDQGPWSRHLELASVSAVMAGGDPVTAHYRDDIEASVIRTRLHRRSKHPTTDQPA